jgi:SWI/SNF-related matrix-associated actin-dependent regulator of chromatin subfamily A member 5
MAETFGRTPESWQLYLEGMPGKTVEQIEEYSKRFWKNYEKIENHKKYVDRIIKGEQEIRRQKMVNEAIEQKHKQIINGETV